MKKFISGLFLNGLLILALALPGLASNHKKMDHPNSNPQSSQDASRGLERAAERRAEQAGEHGMDAMEKQHEHMKMKDAEKMQHEGKEMMKDADKMKREGKEMKKDADKMKHEGREMMKDSDEMKREGKEMMQEGRSGRMDEAAEQAEKTPRKRRWYWPFGDAE